MLFLLPWFISSIIFKSDTVFYKGLNKPSFAPAPIVFPIVWTILYILIAISIYKVYDKNSYKDIPYYNKALIINYFSNQVFSFLFFTLKSPFLAIIDTFIVFISSLFFNLSILFPSTVTYIIWNTFALVLIIFIFFMNL